MRGAAIFILFLIQFVWINAFGAYNDSLFIADCKIFIYKEFGAELDSDYYTKKTKTDQPYIYIFVSRQDTIASPDFGNTQYYYGTDVEKAMRICAEMTAKGYQTFFYKTNANSGTLMNSRFLSYSREAKVFIMFHELTHNYLGQFHVDIPYEFNEALCDVIGNYGALQYAEETLRVNPADVKKQIKSNENIYKCMNLYISKINKNPAKQKDYHEKCSKIIHKILKHCNSFQTDRFDYEVNNAYLLKNQNYCRNYFLLKQVLMKEKTIQNLLELMKRAPEMIAR